MVNVQNAAGLQPVARAAGAANLEEFVSLLQPDQTPHLQRAVAEAMTIHETSFFRDGKVFDILRTTILPRLIDANSATRTLRIWSAASSTGQEAYSVAMLLTEYFPALTDWDLQIVGTDISRSVIEIARRGRYRRIDVNRGLPARMLLKYFARDGEEWEILPKLRSMCSFQDANLREPLPKLPIFDLVLMRNVLLYFAGEDRSAIFRNVYRHITTHGHLVLGASEQAEDWTRLFRAEFAKGCCFYRPVAAP